MSREKIAQLLGCDHSTVEMLERQALHKIRNSPALQQIYAHYSDTQGTGLSRLMDELQQPAGDLLMEYQMQIADFWQVLESCRNGRRRRKILNEIMRCQGLVARELGRISS